MDDGLSWRLTLRPNVLFHDGSPADAAAVKQALEAAAATPGLAVLYPGLSDIRSIRTEGRRTLVVDLHRPSAFFVEDLDLPLTKKSADGTESGTGPYYPVTTADREATLRAQEKYYLGSPHIRELVFKSYPTLRQAWASLLRGEIDVVSNVSSDALEFVTNDAVETFSFPRHYASVIAFNLNRPQLRAAGVRRALNAAIDRQAIIQSVFRGRARPAESPVWPDHWAYDGSVSGYGYEPNLARATLSALGLRLTPGPQDLARLQFTCLVFSEHAVLERLALMVQRQLYDVGVQVRFESLPVTQLDTRLRTGDFDAVLTDIILGPSLSRPYMFWRSPGEFRGLNFFGYRNVEADKWFDRLRFASDDAAIRTATSQLQRVLMDDPPALFLAWSERSRVVSRRIEIPGGRDRDPFVNVWQWRIRAERELTEE